MWQWPEIVTHNANWKLMFPHSSEKWKYQCHLKHILTKWTAHSGYKRDISSQNTKAVLLTMPQTYFCYFMSRLCWMNLYFIINVSLSSKNWVCKFTIIVLIFEVLMAVLSSEMWFYVVIKKMTLFYRDLLPPFLHYRDRLF